MGGVAGRKQPVMMLLALSTLLFLSGIPAALAAQCERIMETSSPMFGASWSDSYVLYTQDYNWKQSGDITKINLYYGEAEGCVKGVKPQYGSDPANAQRLGVETKSLLVRSMQLRAGERIVRAEYKATPKCVEYLSLRTNQGRQLAVGKHDSPTPTAVSAPTDPSSYLGYVNGHTAKPMANPHVGKLMQLQLVWVSAECAEGSTSVSVSAAGNGGKQWGKKKKGAKSGVTASIAGSSSSSSSSLEGSDDSILEQQVGPKCKGNHLCKDGKCATSSCTLAGLGGEVSNMMCYGTNMRLPFLSSGVDVSPCSFLACKLDESSCTSAGLMGMGGFCTGKVVQMGAASMLHPQGKQWLGYPCVEHRPAANLGLRAGMLGELTSAEDMVAKAWKVCDCVKKAPMRNSLAIMMPNGTITSFIFGKGGNQQQKQQEPTVAVPLMPVYNMGIRDVVTQWLAAKAGNAALPTATIPAQLASDLKQLVPGFMTPSILIANTSAALMAHPDWMSEVPVFVLPNPALAALKTFLPDLTSLPTLALATEMSAAEAATLLELPKNLQVADITVDVLPTLASKLGLPTFLKLNPSTSTTKVDSRSDAGPHVVPLDEMHIGNVVVQWATAVSRKTPLPTLTLKSQEQLSRLQEKIPGLVTPSIIVPNISHALLFKPQKPALPIFEVPAELSSEVMAVLPDITSVPSYLVLAEQTKQELPKLQLTDFIAPNMRILVDTLAPAIPMMLKQVAGMAGPTVNVSGDNSALQSFVVGPWGSLLSSITEMPDMFGESSSIDMGSINQVVGAVKAALETSGFKLPYLTMTEDTLQKWGVKKIEGFVTNIVTRAVSPREDPSLIDDSDDVDEESEWRPKNSKRKSRRNRKSQPAGDTDGNPEAVHTAKQHTKVAAVLTSLKEEQQTDAPTQKSEKTKSSKQQQEQKSAGSETQQQQHTSDAATGSKPEPAPTTAAAASSSKSGSGGKKTGNKSSKASSSSSSSSSTDAEPPSKPAYTGGTPTIEDAATTPAAATASAAGPDTAAAVPTTPATAGPKGVPVPTMPADAPPAPAPSAPKSLTPSQLAAEAEKRRAAAAAAEAAAAEKERLQKEALGQQQAAAAAAAAKKGVIPVGTVDEDGAVVVDLADARRAFMTADQWAGVAPEHKEKLIKLLLGSLE